MKYRTLFSGTSSLPNPIVNDNDDVHCKGPQSEGSTYGMNTSHSGSRWESRTQEKTLCYLSDWSAQYGADLPMPPETGDRLGWLAWWRIVETRHDRITGEPPKETTP